MASGSPLSIASIIADIRDSLKCVRFWSVSHVIRDANSLAHNLAS